MIPRHLLIGTAVMLGVALAMSVYLYLVRRNKSLFTSPTMSRVCCERKQLAFRCLLADRSGPRNYCGLCSGCISISYHPILWARVPKCAMYIWWIPDWP